MDLRWVAHDGGVAHMQPPLDDDVPRQFGSEQRERFPHDFLHMHSYPLADSAAAEREDAFDQRVAAFAGDHDVFDIAAQSSAGAHVTKRHLPIAQYRAKEIVEVVSDAARKRTERFQTLSLAQLALDPLQLLYGNMAISDIEHESDHARRFAFGIEEHSSFCLKPTDRTVLVDDPIFSVNVARLRRSVDRASDGRPVFRVDKLLPGLVGAVVRARWNSVHGFQFRRPASLSLAGVDSPLERDGACGLLRQIEHLLARTQLFVDTLTLGDVARDAMVATELAILFEDRRTTGTDVAQCPVGGWAGILEVAERRARRELLTVFGPSARQRHDAVKLPPRLADGR